MDMLNQLNAAVAYVEAHLCDEPDLDAVAHIACVTKDSFLRFFSYITGMTLKEYIRRRKLTLAAYDLQNSNRKVLDVAVKYGWNNADAFTKAFAHQHGITPTQARSAGHPLKVYSPVSFHIAIKGAQKMDFRLIECKETIVFGISQPFDVQGYQTREELRHLMWSEECEDVPGKLCAGRWNQPQNHSYDGIWYGIWQDGRYTIARAKDNVKNGTLETHQIPAGTYAAFQTERGAVAWEEFPRLFHLIFASWLPSAPYQLASDTIIEIYHLWTDHELRKKNRFYEVWIPVKQKD